MSIVNNKFQHKNTSGAALIAVLIVAVVMVVLMGVASKLMDSRLSLALASKQVFQDKAAVYAKTNELTYFIATQRITVAGISQGTSPSGLQENDDGQFINPVAGDEIRADGYTNKDDSDLEYSIQNESGLIPFNSSGQYWLKHWLKSNGNNVAQQARYADIVADYVDPDDWRRPGGAEKREYSDSEPSLPANFLMQSCNELKQILVWRELVAQKPDVLRQCSLRRTTDFNINTIPESLWASLWPQSVDKLKQMRAANSWFIYQSDVLLVEPGFISVPEEMYSTLGGKQFLVEVAKNGISMALRVERGAGLQPPYTIRMAQSQIAD